MKVAISNDRVVADIAALKALTPSTGDIICVESDSSAYYFYSNHNDGDHQSNTSSGWWVKDTMNCSDFWEVVNDDYDFVVNNKTEVNDIEMLDTYGEQRLGYKRTRDLIKISVATNTAMYTTWGSYTHKDIAVKWFAAPYALRLSIWTEAEDEEGWNRLIDETKGIKLESLGGRSLAIEIMRRHISHQLRKETMTKEQLDDFYFSTEADFSAYIDTNSNNFKDWILSTNDHVSNGFASKTVVPMDYYNEDLRDELINIYNGNY